MFSQLRKAARFHLLRRRAARAISALNPHADSILITGLARSGSTWLQEALAQWPGTLCLFEPVHKQVPQSTPALTLGDGAPGEPDPATPGEAAAIDAILRGHVLTPWTLQSTTIPAAPVRRLCVKLINCNNGLPRLLRSIPLRHAPVVLLRHPCAHVASWARLGWASRFANLESRFPRLLAAEPHLRDVLASLSDPLDLMTAAWCLGNRVPLSTDAAGRWVTLHYESLRADPHTTLKTLFQTWGHPDVPPEVLAAVRRPSRTTWRESGSATAPPDAAPWKSQLSPADRSRIYALCARLGVQADDDHYAAM